MIEDIEQRVGKLLLTYHGITSKSEIEVLLTKVTHLENHLYLSNDVRVNLEEKDGIVHIRSDQQEYDFKICSKGKDGHTKEVDVHYFSSEAVLKITIGKGKYELHQNVLGSPHETPI